MKVSSIVPGLVLLNLVSASCPYAKRALEDAKKQEHASNIKERQTGPGGLPFTTFNENQRVSVTGQHAWRAPGPNDIRGPCPGLNVLSNHGYFPRNGVVSLAQAATATNEVFGLALNFGVPLTVYATLVDGDILRQEWSIGGPQPRGIIPIIGPADGLSGSHNKYEGDASPGRGDYYLENGDVASLKVAKFKNLYDLRKNDPVPNYDLATLVTHRNYTWHLSESTNPYFFSPPFAGLAVANAAHTFIPALMSNHSAAYPNGLLDKETLKSFFAITESPSGALSWTPGYERIPDVWYRRPLGVANEYTPTSFGQDLISIAAVVPDAVSVGGNTGTVNSFAGANLGDITGGAYNTADLTNPQKFSCYFYQIVLAVVPDFLRSQALGTVLGTALSLLNTKISPFVDPACATIGNYDDSFTAQFPGAALP
ncbi:MAG: hypothetical protein M1833_001697 [Piccolia ochrophora]|nr:MAG: hypothetical protein M1833_001697 [Piccolia ochrophora]